MTTRDPKIIIDRNANLDVYFEAASKWKIQ